jgi:hypothetical protein
MPPAMGSSLPTSSRMVMSTVCHSARVLQSAWSSQTRGRGETAGVVPLRECPDLFFIDLVGAAHKPLPDLQVFEEEKRFLLVWLQVRHDELLLDGCFSPDRFGAKDSAFRATKSRALVVGLPRIPSTVGEIDDLRDLGRIPIGLDLDCFHGYSLGGRSPIRLRD